MPLSWGSWSITGPGRGVASTCGAGVVVDLGQLRTMCVRGVPRSRCTVISVGCARPGASAALASGRWGRPPIARHPLGIRGRLMDDSQWTWPLSLLGDLAEFVALVVLGALSLRVLPSTRRWRLEATQGLLGPGQRLESASSGVHRNWRGASTAPPSGLNKQASSGRAISASRPRR